LLPEARQDRAAKKVVVFYPGRARRSVLIGSCHWLKEECVKSLADLLQPPMPTEERLRGFTRLAEVR